MVGLAQMVRASDCGPEGRRFDPDIPPHQWASKSDEHGLRQRSIPISHPGCLTICECSTVVSMQVFQT